jgi:hypothetical protein
MGTGLLNMAMVEDTMGNGNKINRMVWVLFTLMIGMDFIKEKSKMIGSMERECFFIMMEVSMMGIGTRI